MKLQGQETIELRTEVFQLKARTKAAEEKLKYMEKEERKYVEKLREEYYNANQALIKRLLTVKEQLAALVPLAWTGIINTQSALRRPGPGGNSLDPATHEIRKKIEAAKAALRELEGK